MNTTEFIEKIGAYVQKYAPTYGICVHSPIIAQAVLESARGTSELAVNANNYFGLKYKPGRCPTATGSYTKVGSEQKADGTYTSASMQWFAFPDMEACVRGYFDFINNSRYANLKGVTDPETYLKYIKADRYATSLNYVQNLMAVIERYNLTRFDERKKVNTMKIAIDAGHGSNTAGKRTPDDYREHWANVKVASYFAAAMDRCGVSYIKTGWDDDNSKDDPDTSLAARQKAIRAAGCDYSISFHFNACGNGKTYNSGEGIETLISNKAPADSRRMAECIQKQLIQGTKQKNRGVKTQSLAMCNCSVMGTKASVLIECAFMTNKRESELMQSAAFCMECAEEAAKGFCEYAEIEYVASGAAPVQQPKVNHTTQQKSYVYNGIDYAMVFNPTYYAQVNTDVKKAFGNNEKKLFEHFCKNGMKEGRVAIETFNVLVYKSNNADLQKAFGNNLPDYYKHYIQYGHKEGRKVV